MYNYPMRKLYKISRIYGTAINLYLATIAGISISVFLYFRWTSNYDETLKIAVGSWLTLLTTSAGIFIPLLVSRNQQESDDRRSFVFALSSLWSELRADSRILNQIIVNFQFREILQIPNFEFMANTLSNKYSALAENMKLIENGSYYAAQNSNAFTKFDDDDTYNAVMSAYENISMVKAMMLIAGSDVELKKYLATQKIDPLRVEEEVFFREQVSGSLDRAYRDLIVVNQKINEAIIAVENKLTKMGTNVTFESRGIDDTLSTP